MIKKIVSLLVIAFIFIAVAEPVFAIEYGGFGGRPAFPRDDSPRTESIFVHTLRPGETQKEGVRIINNSSGQKTFIVYASDSQKSTDGAFACEQSADTKDGVGSWIDLEEGEITLAPNSNKVIPFNIVVPENASVGEHNGCILIQEKKEDVGQQAGVNLSVRTGLRVLLTVPGNIQIDLSPVSLEVTRRDNGNFIIHPVVKNSGNVSVDTDVKVVTKSILGPEIAQHGGKFPILRGETSEWNFELKRPMFGGWYTTSYSLVYDQNPNVKSGNTSDSEFVTVKGQSKTFFTLPTLLGFAIELAIVIVLALLAGYIYLKKKQSKWIATSWELHTVKSKDSINSLAEKFNVSWKLLAKVNNIKAPYQITTGETIKVPPTE